VRKAKAFIVALILFCFTVYGLHFYSIQAIGLDNNEFSTWSNKAKFNSPEAIKANLNEHTVVVFGSSEFQHGQRTIYHPKAMFKDFNFNPMLIGAGYYQSLEHAITLASIGETIPSKKVVLLLSPTWFKKQGVVDTAFASRFSESSYIEMLRNQKLSPERKEYMMKRSNALLGVDKSTLKRVELYERVLMKKDSTLMDEWNYKVYTDFLDEKSRQGVILQAKMANIKSNQNKENTDRDIDWKAYWLKAERQGEQHNDNPFYMAPKGFMKVKYKYDGLPPERAKQVKNCYSDSPEYEDFKCFLDICKELNIEPLIVALPVNGYWYEHAGFPAETREQYYENIRMITKEYGVQLADLSHEEFTKYFFEDGVHLGGKGWVAVNEILYNFYNETEKQSEM